MKFCKKCHKRVVKEALTSKDFYNVCLCGDGYLVTETPEVTGFLEATATQRNRKAKKNILPNDIPYMEPYPNGYAILQIIKMSLLFGYSSGLETIEEDIDMNGNRIIDLPSPTTDSEPVTKGYADTNYSGGSGQQGPKGDKGDTGPQGPKGDKRDVGLQGPQGPKGNTGSRGPKGDQGPQGLKGSRGLTGTQGPKGDKGDTGPQGDKGDTGLQGQKETKEIQVYKD